MVPIEQKYSNFIILFVQTYCKLCAFLKVAALWSVMNAKKSLDQHVDPVQENAVTDKCYVNVHSNIYKKNMLG